MKYTVLEKLSYEGKTYEKGQIIDITDKTVANTCLERKLISKELTETKEIEPVEDVTEVTKAKSKNKKSGNE